MQEMFKAMGQAMPDQKKILELNPSHKLVEVLKQEFESNAASPLLKGYITLLHEQALIADGDKLSNPLAFTKKLTDLMLKAVK